MSLVVNMQQRRTVATGRQNQDPNTTFPPEKEKTPKKPLSKFDQSIEEVLSRKRNTSGRARRMVLAHLVQRKAAAEKTPPAASKDSQSGKNSLGDSAKKNGYSETARSTVVSVKQNGNKLSTSDIRKRPLDQEDSRAPFSALNASTENEPENDRLDFTANSPAKPSPKDRQYVYSRKKPNTGTTPETTPPTPPQKSYNSRWLQKVESSPLPNLRSPGFITSRRQEVKETSPAPPPPKSDSSKREEIKETTPPPSPPPLRSSGLNSIRGKEVKQASPPPPPSPPLKSPGFNTSRQQEVKETSPPPPLPSVVDSTSSEKINEKVSSVEAFRPIVEQVAAIEVLHPVRRQLMTPSPPREQSDPYVYPPARANVEVLNPLPLFRGSGTQGLGVEGQIFSFTANSPRRLHGLMNLGNTCYMNVIIQILCNLPSFVASMERFFGPLVKQNALEGSESLSSSDVESIHAALLIVFRDLKRAERYETVNPTVLKHAFAKHQSSFWGCIQQDAHEFFCSLIDQVQEDVSSELKKQFSIEANRPKLETVCPTTQNFSCSVRNNLTCAGCGNVSSVEETYRDFSLALPEDERTDESKSCTLESLLNLYFQETTMSRKCEKCGVEDTKAQAQILKLPHVLVLQLKRLHMDRDVPSKISTPVKFSSLLDIGPWCAKDKQKFWTPAIDGVQNSANSSGVGVNSRYRLHGVVNHLGHSSSGHFLTDILDPQAGRWLRCDDSLVTDVSEDSVFANVREAYMFFYVHERV